MQRQKNCCSNLNHRENKSGCVLLATGVYSNVNFRQFIVYLHILRPERGGWHFYYVHVGPACTAPNKSRLGPNVIIVRLYIVSRSGESEPPHHDTQQHAVTAIVNWTPSSFQTMSFGIRSFSTAEPSYSLPTYVLNCDSLTLFIARFKLIGFLLSLANSLDLSAFCQRL